MSSISHSRVVAKTGVVLTPVPRVWNAIGFVVVVGASVVVVGDTVVVGATVVGGAAVVVGAWVANPANEAGALVLIATDVAVAATFFPRPSQRPPPQRG